MIFVFLLIKAKTKLSNYHSKKFKLSDLEFLEVEEDEAIEEEQIIRGVYRENVRRRLAKLNVFLSVIPQAGLKPTTPLSQHPRAQEKDPSDLDVKIVEPKN